MNNKKFPIELTRFLALKVVDNAFEKAYSDLGGGDSFIEDLEGFGLAKFNEEDELIGDYPGMFDIYLALGFSKKEILEITKWNKQCFDEYPDNPSYMEVLENFIQDLMNEIGQDGVSRKIQEIAIKNEIPLTKEQAQRGWVKPSNAYKNNSKKESE